MKKHKWQGLKVLSLPKWVFYECCKNDLVDFYAEITPIFNRNGRYYFKSSCWMEVNGRAYLDGKEDFLYELQLMNAPYFTTEQVHALSILDKWNMLNRKQREDLRLFNERELCKQVGRSSTIKFLQFKKTKSK